ncbi:expressed unknown protein [Seminavis robusta]|uniref:Phytanoyl-CoA dioxygenase n=1 Tax=Seminavis robusta TaxID=568900 RepID=A0A9N8E4Z5_9STRA|nr:expressed unknown protein [Seminavis robusta]|eukprot:Sro624_g177320.1 n/a (263) ;mRNA; r:24449-25237
MSWSRISRFAVLTAAVHPIGALVSVASDAPVISNQIVLSKLFDQSFCVMENIVDPTTLTECSRLAASVFENEGGHDGTYLGKPWKSSRIYIDGQNVWQPNQDSTATAPVDAAFMEPIIKCVRRKLATELGLVPKTANNLDELCQKAMPLESAFTNHYIGIGNAPRDMSNHIDCDCNGNPVPLSVVIQGVYDHNHATGEILGKLDCQTAKKDQPVQTVPLSAGDGLVLAGALHKPHPVPESAKRLVFVLFFSELNYMKDVLER